MLLQKYSDLIRIQVDYYEKCFTDKKEAINELS